MKKKIIWGWILAVLITLGAAVYQRLSGPTYPKRGQIELQEKAYSYRLPRSHSSNSDCEVKIPVTDPAVSAVLIFRKYPTRDAWDTLSFERTPEGLSAFLPKQPPAGKLEYFIRFADAGIARDIHVEDHVVVRYKGDVPAFILIPHILFMFLAMLFSNLAALMAGFRLSRARIFTLVTFVLMLLGGMILGPVVQKYAFGEFWTGIPFGWDLTDNKTLIAFAAWIIALFANRRKFSPVAIITAGLITLIVFSIPHSLFGSELNPVTGSISQG